MPNRKFRWFAWWYGAIAAGFALLALEHLMTHDRPVMIVLRMVIAGGFAFLAYAEFHSKKS